MFNLLVGLALGLAMATARNGPVEHLRLENEIVVLAACQFLFVLYYVFAFPTLHGTARTGTIHPTFVLSSHNPQNERFHLSPSAQNTFYVLVPSTRASPQIKQ